MTPEGEGKLVVDACQDCNEMRFESLDGALRLVLSVVSRWHKLKLDFLFADILLERIGRFVIQRVLYYSQSCQSHSVDYLLICPYHLLLHPVAHWFDENIFCVEVDGHHYVPVASLRCEGECSRLIGVDGISEVIDAEESLVRFGDGYLVER